MIDTPQIILAVRQALMMRFAVVVSLPDPRHAGNTKGPNPDDIRDTKIVDVRRDPAAVVELEQMRGSFVVTANEESQVWGLSSTGVIRGEVA